MKTAREWGLMPEGRLRPGPGNAITDVAGVSVGHRSLRGDGLFTGVTAVIPHPGDLFRLKPRAAVEVVNGFGKSAGLMQVAGLLREVRQRPDPPQSRSSRRRPSRKPPRPAPSSVA